MLIVPKVPVLVSVIFFLPDFPSLVQRLDWGIEDEAPRFPRFWDYIEVWRTKVDATVKEILVDTGRVPGPRGFRSIAEVYTLQ